MKQVQVISGMLGLMGSAVLCPFGTTMTSANFLFACCFLSKSCLESFCILGGCFVFVLVF